MAVAIGGTWPKDWYGVMYESEAEAEFAYKRDEMERRRSDMDNSNDPFEQSTF